MPTSSRRSCSTATTERPSSIAPVGIITLILWILQFGLGIGLIFLVLIHSGKGGGLSDMFGGGLGASAAGSTVMEKNLDRVTVVIALLFAFNTLIMALVLDT
ncbi:MAG: preprotein translocase subunit SecG [Microthrixaceae bacterium]|nr:preprotein translocase subunit SecG [Microthrixaceae bacterium]